MFSDWNELVSPRIPVGTRLGKNVQNTCCISFQKQNHPKLATPSGHVKQWRKAQKFRINRFKEVKPRELAYTVAAFHKSKVS